MCKLYFKFMTFLARKIFPRPDFIYEEKPEENEPCVYLSNHAGPVGPVYSALYFEGERKIWLINYIMRRRKNVKYIYHDFLCATKKKHQWGWKILAKIISILLTPLLERIPHIEVYHDARMMDTFRESLDALSAGKSLIIFPESPTEFSPYINAFYEGFAEIGRLYYTETGKCLKFYPTYVCKDLQKVVVGRPVIYDPTVPAKQQRKMICEAACREIERIAENLPEHKIHPFLSEEWYDCYGEFVTNPAGYWKMFD